MFAQLVKFAKVDVSFPIIRIMIILYVYFLATYHSSRLVVINLVVLIIATMLHSCISLVHIVLLNVGTTFPKGREYVAGLAFTQLY